MEIWFLAKNYAEIAQLVEHDLAKVGAASSSLVSRSDKMGASEEGAPFFIVRLGFNSGRPVQGAGI